MSLASPLLALLAVAQAGVLSPLVEANHVHDWVEVHRTEDGLAEIDLATGGDMEIGDKAYRTTLMRMSQLPVIEGSMMVDIKLAVDCDKSRVAAVQVWTSLMPGRLIEEVPEDQIDFEQAGFMPPAARAALFQRVCGPDWTDTTSE